MLIKKLANFSVYIVLGMQSLLCFAETNYATTSTIRTSSVAGSLSPAFVADGNLDTSWGSGSFANAWIEFDFETSKSVTEIRVTVDQAPSGETIHQVFVDDALSHTWQGITEKGNELIWVPPAGVNAQKIRIETVSSPSWVGWKEISILGPDAAPIPNPNQPKNTFSVLAENLDIAVTLIEYKSAQQSIFYRGNFTYIGTNAANELLWKVKDYQFMDNTLGYTEIPTIDELSNLDIKINRITFGKINYWAELEFIGDNGQPGALVWKLNKYGIN